MKWVLLIGGGIAVWIFALSQSAVAQDDPNATPDIQPIDTETTDMPSTANIPEFDAKVIAVCASVGIPDAGWLMACMKFESGLNPAAHNRQSGATGLIQFTDVGLNAAGITLTRAQLGQQDAVTQLDSVQQYMEQYSGRFQNLGDVYMAIFAPAAIGQSDDAILYRSPSKAYSQNSGLDRIGKGYITRGDAIAQVQPIYDNDFSDFMALNA